MLRFVKIKGDYLYYFTSTQNIPTEVIKRFEVKVAGRDQETYN